MYVPCYGRIGSLSQVYFDLLDEDVWMVEKCFFCYDGSFAIEISLFLL